jgi:hypothetical protein
MESNGDQKPKTDMHTSKGQTKVGVGLNKIKKQNSEKIKRAETKKIKYRFILL